MIGIDGIRARVFKHALHEHGACSTEVFLSRLEYEQHGSRQLFPYRCKAFGKCHAYCGVNVVAAYMSDAGNLGCKGNRIRLIRRHRIHVGPKSSYWPGFATLE